MPKARLLLTGATGFVGQQILANLPTGFEIHGVSRQRPGRSDIRFHAVDLTDADQCRQLIADVKPTHLVHCAWETAHGEFWHSDSNLNWLEAGKALFSAFVQQGGQRIISCGSCAEYARPDKNPVVESDDKHPPATLYGRSKLNLLGFLQDMPVSFAWPRIFLTYGPYEDKRRFVPSVALSVLSGQQARCSSGQQIRDFIDVRDLGRAIAGLSVCDVRGAINLGQGVQTRLGDVAERLGKLAGQPGLIRLGALPDRQDEPPVLVPDLTRQQNELNFRPGIDLDQGLTYALDWWQKNQPRDDRHDGPSDGPSDEQG